MRAHGKAILGTTVISFLTVMAGTCTLDAQEGPPEAKIETPDSGRPYPPRVVDGQRRGLPEEVFAVAPGTRFLVGLEQEMNTKSLRRNQAFQVRTLEPLEAGQGFYLPAGAVIEGHVSRVEPAGKAGRAKLWLTFDEIRTRFGRLPIVAEVASLPGDHTTKNGPMTNGAIEGHGSTPKDAAQAAATGAAMGALKGVQDKNKKEAAEAAAIAALEAYLMEAGRGEELDLPKGTKLELELGRALYLVKE
ncbi:MAG TPA: hypothetical protein VKB21_04155 [Candidatus Acidoferrum sp.]|nr:hypothetical protein [Candidatus Acidoferrum sp.]